MDLDPKCIFVQRERDLDVHHPVHRNTHYGTRIDLVKRHDRKDIFYEIKTYPDVLISIRVGVG